MIRMGMGFVMRLILVLLLVALTRMHVIMMQVLVKTMDRVRIWVPMLRCHMNGRGPRPVGQVLVVWFLTRVPIP